MPSHRVPPRRRAHRRGRLWASGLAALAALLTGGYLLGHDTTSQARPTAAAEPGTASCPAAGHSAAACGHQAPRPHRGSSSPAAPGPKPRRWHRPGPGHTAPAPTPAPTATLTSTSGSADARAAASVLALVNQARAQAGLPGYTVTAGLDASASRPDRRMADGCGLSHQCPGEPPLGDRETAAGVHWTAAGENIGEGGPVAGLAAAITRMAVALTQDMLNEKPPDDGHRQNLLSSTFTHIGIVISRDSSGTVWMTQDLSN